MNDSVDRIRNEVDEEFERQLSRISSRFPEGILITPTQMLIVEELENAVNGLSDVRRRIKERTSRDIALETIRRHLMFLYRQIDLSAKKLGQAKTRRIIVELKRRGMFKAADRRFHS